MKPAVVFLHGAGLGAWMWRPQIEALPQFHCLAPDLPAHGSNLSHPWRSIRDSAQWVAEFIAQEAGGRAHVVGLSLGAVIGYELLATFPDSVDRLVLSGGMGLGKPGRTMLGRLMRGLMPLATNRRVVAATLALMKVPTEDRPVGLREMSAMSPAVLADIVDEVLSYRLDAELSLRPHSVLAIAGTMEALGIKETVKGLAALMPAAKAAFVARGLHTWNWQYPELFTGTVGAWLSGKPLPDRLRLEAP